MGKRKPLGISVQRMSQCTVSLSVKAVSSFTSELNEAFVRQGENKDKKKGNVFSTQYLSSCSDFGPQGRPLPMPEFPPLHGLESLSSQLRSKSPEADGILCFIAEERST